MEKTMLRERHKKAHFVNFKRILGQVKPCLQVEKNSQRVAYEKTLFNLFIMDNK